MSKRKIFTGLLLAVCMLVGCVKREQEEREAREKAEAAAAEAARLKRENSKWNNFKKGIVNFGKQIMTGDDD